MAKSTLHTTRATLGGRSLQFIDGLIRVSLWLVYYGIIAPLNLLLCLFEPVRHAARYLSSMLQELWLTLAHTPYLFCRTPDELGTQTRKLFDTDDDWVYVTVRTGVGAVDEPYMKVNPIPPPGHVYVKLYRDLDCLWQDSAVMAFVRLEADGSLDLKKIRRKWNLHNCYPVDSVRMEVFETETPGNLSPMALSILNENQYWLRVIELPTQRVLNMRARRLRFIAAYRHLMAWLRDLPAMLQQLATHGLPEQLSRLSCCLRRRSAEVTSAAYALATKTAHTLLLARDVLAATPRHLRSLVRDVREFLDDLREAIRTVRCGVRHELGISSHTKAREDNQPWTTVRLIGAIVIAVAVVDHIQQEIL